MKTKCEVIGWVHDDAESAKVLILEEGGRVSSQAAHHKQSPSPFTVQTGAFMRWKRVVDPVTRETLAYEIERLPSALRLV